MQQNTPQTKQPEKEEKQVEEKKPKEKEKPGQTSPEIDFENLNSKFKKCVIGENGKKKYNADDFFDQISNST